MDPKQIEAGARQAVDNCVKLRKHEKVVIITDKETEHLARAIEKVAAEKTPNIKFFVMEDFGPRPEDGSDPLKFPEELGEAMKDAEVSFYIAQGKPGEIHTFRKPMLALVNDLHIRHAHMISFEERMMAEGMATDYNQIQELTKKIWKVVKDAKTIRVTTPAGTDVTATFTPKYKWVRADGNITRDNWSNLPDGEIFTPPIDMVGHLVIDGVLGDFFSEKYGSLENNPVEIDLKNGRAIKDSVKCKNNNLLAELKDYLFGGTENSDRVGEFGIGTNIGLKHLIGNLLQDEKFPGVHIAFGDPYSNKTGADWSSKTHLDGVLKSPTIIADDKVIMKDGKFLI